MKLLFSLSSSDRYFIPQFPNISNNNFYFQYNLSNSRIKELLTDRKQRFFYKFTPANRAFTGLFEPFPFLKHKATLSALCRNDIQLSFLLAKSFLYVMKMINHLFFLNMDLSGYITSCQERSSHDRYHLLPNRFNPANRDKRLFYLFFHSERQVMGNR